MHVSIGIVEVELYLPLTLCHENSYEGPSGKTCLLWASQTCEDNKNRTRQEDKEDRAEHGRTGATKEHPKGGIYRAATAAMFAKLLKNVASLLTCSSPWVFFALHIHPVWCALICSADEDANAQEESP